MVRLIHAGRALVVVFVGLLGAGCTSEWTRDAEESSRERVAFTMTRQEARLVPSAYALEVEPVADRRVESESRFGWWRWIPGAGRQERSTAYPERLAAFDFEPGRDIARLLEDHAAHAKLFRHVRLEPEEAGSPDTAACTLRTTLHRLELVESRWHYRLGFLAFPLWFLGAPLGETVVRLEMGLTVLSPSGEPLWEGILAGDRRRFLPLFANVDVRRAFLLDLMSIVRSEWLRALKEISVAVRRG